MDSLFAIKTLSLYLINFSIGSRPAIPGIAETVMHLPEVNFMSL